MLPSSVSILTLLFTVTTAQTDYLGNAKTALTALQDSWYNETSGLWTPSMGWWNSANGLTTIADLAKIDSGTKDYSVGIFSTAYKNAPEFNPKNEVEKIATSENIWTFYGIPPGVADGLIETNDATTAEEGTGNADGFVNSCYDDNGWWALAWIGAWDLTNNQDYIATAQGIFEQMSSGGPTNCSNGGIIWCSDADYYVNAIANELYLSVAANLANRVSDPKYLQAAESQWNWFKNSGMINSENLINDGLDRETCENNNQTVWTYNMGVVLGALVELQKAKGGGDYLDQAHTLASASISHFAGSNQVIHESCEPDCAPDGTQFKGVFMRNLMALHKASPKALYQQVINANADAIWASDRNDQNQLSVDWDGPFVNPANASTHSSAMDALVAAAAIN